MGDNDIKDSGSKSDETKKGSAKTPPEAPPAGEPKKYEYIGPAAGARGQALSYPGQRAIVPSKMTDVQIAALEKSNPALFARLWEVKS